MSKKRIALVDLDGCYVLRDKSFFDRVIEKLAGLFIEEARVEGITLFFQILRDNKNIYEVNEEIDSFLRSQEFDEEFILTARRRKDLDSLRIEKLTDLCEKFDSIIFYPGRTIEGENLLEMESSKLKYFLGMDYVDYKIRVAEEFSKDKEVFIVDNSEKIIEAATTQEYIKKQFLVNGRKIFEVDKEGNKRRLEV